MTDFDVIVVGAGAAGLAATRHLMEVGREVTCLESADRIGGRAYTDTTIFGVPFDMGAHWLHYGAQNAFVPIGRNSGFDIYEASEELFFKGDLSEAAFDRVLHTLEQKVQAPQDMPMSKAVIPRDDQERTALFLKALSAGRDLDEISMHEWATAGLEQDNWYCREGFGTIVTRNGAGLPVHLNAPVKDISRTKARVEIETLGGKMTARQVIVTVSVGVLASEAIRFDPPLETARLRALDAITMGTYNHIALQFTHDSLPVGPDTWAGYPITELSGTHAPDGGILTNISGTGLCVFEHIGSFARELEDAGPETAITFALDQMANVFGSDVRKGFVKGFATRWASNPHTRGAYSGTLPSGAGQRGALRSAHAETIHFAGEAMNEGETVTVSGAHKEGLRAAKDALAAL
ncbi:MAG: NAD(P)/FAD-dependent oxidoreductase [Pseudomonadota bacterium]